MAIIAARKVMTMHDPMVVAFEIPSPIPHRDRWREKRGKRWGFDVDRGTGPNNLGKRVYPWWRLKGRTLKLGGRAYTLGRLATIWHVEPKGRDSGEVCKHYIRSTEPQPSPLRVRLSPFLKAYPGSPESVGATKPWIANRAWKWHVHHWRIQIPALQGLRARLFDRCALCGRKGRPNHSFQWESRGLGWRKWRSREGLYHSECSSLHHLRRVQAEDEDTMRELVSAFRVLADVDEEEAINRLGDAFKSSGDWTAGFRRERRLAHLMGYDMRQRDARWVKAEGRERTPEGLLR